MANSPSISSIVETLDAETVTIPANGRPSTAVDASKYKEELK